MLTINIIYVGGTVKLLLPFVMTLLHHSDCSFRLVANGCEPAEVALLQAICKRHERLKYESFPSDTVVAHGQVLNYLQQLESSPYFAFIDSDIFATGSFIEQCLQHLQNYSAIFSCPPFWHSEQDLVMPQGFSYMGGRFLWSHHGRFLGNTYFAIYHSERLAAFIQSTGLSFLNYKWEDLAIEHQRVLEDLGLQAKSYDTSKVLNILLQQQGAQLAYLPLSTLVHLGGISFPTFRRSSLIYELRRLLPEPIYILLRMLQSSSYRSATMSERRMRVPRFQQRETIQRYFFLILQQESGEKARQKYLRDLPPTLQQEVLMVGQQVQRIVQSYPFD